MNDYQGFHTPPMSDSGAALHDLTGKSNGFGGYPDDVYSPNAVRYYGTGEPSLDRQAYAVIQGAHGKPEARVTVYRAVPYVPSSGERIETLERQKRHILKHGTLPSGVETALDPRAHYSAYYNQISEEIDRLRAGPQAPAREITTINPGDWVTTVRAYAAGHAEGPLGGAAKIIHKSVRARELFTNGDSWLEYGYDPGGGTQGQHVRGVQALTFEAVW